MRVAIIVPPYPLEEAPAPPLGITYVAAAFEAAGAQVQIFDYLVSSYSPEKLARQLHTFDPQVVGITSVTLNFSRAAEIISKAKELKPDIVTIMGGPHVSFTAAEVLDNYPGIDLIVIGEGEETIRELLPVIHRRDRWENVAGIAFRRAGCPVTTPPRQAIADLNSIPLPARHLLPLSRYQALGYSVSIITSRGCPYNCIFCAGRRMVGSKVRTRSTKLVVDEIEQILSYGFKRINVADDLFVANKKRVLGICGEIERRGLKFAWSAFARVNTVDKEILQAMRRAGCDAVSFGVESGNQEILDRVGKSITPEMVRRAVRLCHDAGVLPHTSFMVGLPGETPETLAETSQFAKNLGALYGYHFLAPFPGTPLREKVSEYDLEILTDDWSRYDANTAIVKTKNLTPEEMNRFVAQYNEEIRLTWEHMVSGYGKTNTPEIDLQVRGHFRTRLVYRILVEDMIEKYESPATGLAIAEQEERAIEDLSRFIHDQTGDDFNLIAETIRTLFAAGYLEMRLQGNVPRWTWAANKTAV